MSALYSPKPQVKSSFSKSGLVEGAIVEITGQQLKIKTFDGQNGQRLSIELIDARLGYIGTVGQGQAPQQQAPQQAPAQGGYQQPQQQRPAPQQQMQQGGYGNQPQQSASCRKACHNRESSDQQPQWCNTLRWTATAKNVGYPSNKH